MDKKFLTLLDSVNSGENGNYNSVLDLFDVRVGSDFNKYSEELAFWLQRNIGKDSVGNFREKVFDAYCTGLFHVSWKDSKYDPDILDHIKNLSLLEISYGNLAFSNAFLGIYSFLKFERVAAWGHFTVASQYANLMRMDKIGVCTALDPEIVKKLTLSDYSSNLIDFNPISVKISSKVRRDFVVVVAADVRYFLAFANDLIKSLSEVKSKSGIHFHIIGDFSEIEEELLKISKNFPDLFNTLSLSLEKVPANLKASDRASFFACSRFFRSFDLLNFLECDFVIVDIDSLFVSDPQKWAFEQNRSDININIPTGPGTYVPWRTVGAGTILVSNNEKSHLFLSLLKGSLMCMWDLARERRWWIDQNALYSARYSWEMITGEKIKSLKNVSSFVYYLSGKEKNKKLNSTIS